MPVEKCQVKTVKGTCLFSMTFFPVVLACVTVIAHAVDVFSRGNIGLGGDETAIGKLAHGPGVWKFNPLNGIDVHAQIPLIDRIRIDPRQQSEISGHHQSLDMMGIGVLE